MARVRRRRSFRQGTGRVRPNWARQHAQAALTAGTPANLNLLADYQQLRGTTSIDPGCTIIGGWVSLQITASTVTATTSKVAIGIIVVDENTAVQVPNPFDHPHVDWMFYRVGHLTSVGGAVANYTLDNVQIRSKRRMDEVGMNVYASIVSQAAADYQLDTSILLRR